MSASLAINSTTTDSDTSSTTTAMDEASGGNNEPKAGMLLEDIIAKVDKQMSMERRILVATAAATTTPSDTTNLHDQGLGNKVKQSMMSEMTGDDICAAKMSSPCSSSHSSNATLDLTIHNNNNNTDNNNNIEEDEDEHRPGVEANNTDHHHQTREAPHADIDKERITTTTTTTTTTDDDQSKLDNQHHRQSTSDSESNTNTTANNLDEGEPLKQQSLTSTSSLDNKLSSPLEEGPSTSIQHHHHHPPTVLRSDSHSSTTSSTCGAPTLASPTSSSSQPAAIVSSIEGPMLQVNSRPSAVSTNSAAVIHIKSEPESPPPPGLAYHHHHQQQQQQQQHHLQGLINDNNNTNTLQHQQSHSSNSSSSSHLSESCTNQSSTMLATSAPSTPTLADYQQQHHTSPVVSQQQLNLSNNSSPHAPNSLLCPPGLGHGQQQPQPQQQFHHHGHHGHGTPHHHQLSQTSLLTMTPTGVAGGVSVVASSSPADPKDCIEEFCPVCGDRVSGYHYGLLTCESCKGFFKRTVQNKKVYTCVADRTCHIDKSQRKRCPYCRFQKCLDVGMKLEAVRADRMRGGRNKFGPMYKRDRARRMQVMRQKQLTKVVHSGLGGQGLNGLNAPPGVTILSGGLAAASAAADGLNFVTPSGGHLFDGLKQELIQIPQLSSSTSSPDSSPSPGLAAAVAAAAAAANGQAGAPHFNLQVMQNAAGGGAQQPQLGSAGMSLGGQHSASVTMTGGGSAGDYRTAAGSSHLGGGNGRHAYDNKTLLAQAQQQQPTLPQLIRELQTSMPDDKEWQIQLFGLLQNQTYNQCEVDLFELMCKVIDQSLFAQVDWARNSIFFKELKVDDQMKLLQHAWSDMLMLDHIHQRLHVGLPDDTTLPNGQKFDLLALALLGVTESSDQLHAVTARLSELKLDPVDYICLKFLLLLNPEVRQLNNVRLVNDAHEQTKQALHQYTLTHYPQNPNKFHQLLSLVPEIRQLTVRGEDFLYYRHMSGQAPNQTLLMEMLHAKKK